MTHWFRSGARPFAVLIMLILTALLLLAACGGDDDDDGGDNGTAEPTAAGAGVGESDGGDEPIFTDDAGDNDGTPTEEAGDDGGDDSGRDSATAVDACALITTDEVAAVLGAPVEATEEIIEPSYSCRYETDEFAGVNVTAFVAPSNDDARAFFESASEGTEQIDGLGEAAHWSSEPLYTIEALDGVYVVDVSTYGLVEIDRLAAARKLLNVALTRLQ